MPTQRGFESPEERKERANAEAAEQRRRRKLPTRTLLPDFDEVSSTVKSILCEYAEREGPLRSDASYILGQRSWNPHGELGYWDVMDANGAHHEVNLERDASSGKPILTTTSRELADALHEESGVAVELFGYEPYVDSFMPNNKGVSRISRKKY